MVQSMTAFSNVDREISNRLFSWELRSVNHRYLDVSLRLPDSFRFLEPELRRRISNVIRRGRIEVSLSWKKTHIRNASITINQALVLRLTAAVKEVELLTGHTFPSYSAFDILQWPGVFQESDQEPDMDPYQLSKPIFELFDDALQQITVEREREGQYLAQHIRERCHTLYEYISMVQIRLPESLKALKTRWFSRIEEVSADFDRSRLEQEIVYFAQKLDIAEEVDRLNTHIHEIQQILLRNEPVGRRLDFLLQEINREVNTLGSKSADAVLTTASVEMKVLIEQIREQVQNIE